MAESHFRSEGPHAMAEGRRLLRFDFTFKPGRPYYQTTNLPMVATKAPHAFINKTRNYATTINTTTNPQINTTIIIHPHPRLLGVRGAGQILVLLLMHLHQKKYGSEYGWSVRPHQNDCFSIFARPPRRRCWVCGIIE